MATQEQETAALNGIVAASNILPYDMLGKISESTPHWYARSGLPLTAAFALELVAIPEDFARLRVLHTLTFNGVMVDASILPASLTRLIMPYNHCLDASTLPRSLRHLEIGQISSLSGAPDLISLIISCERRVLMFGPSAACDLLDELPATLEDFRYNGRILRQKVMSCMPRGLKTLSLVVDGDFDTHAMPQGLTDLSLILSNYRRANDLSCIPHTVTRLRIQNLNPYSIQTISYTASVVSLALGGVDYTGLREMKNIKEFTNTDFQPIDIQMLPASITKLKGIFRNTKDISLLFPALVDLDLNFARNDGYGALPQTLRKLKLTCSGIGKRLAFDDLPDGLTDLTLHAALDVHFADFPKSLTRLSLPGARTSPYGLNKLTSLVYLELKSLTEKALEIPKTLRVIKVGKYKHGDFSSSNLTHFESTMETSEIPLMPDSITSLKLPNATPIALSHLPRGLLDLKLHSLGDFADVADLPQGLRRLSLGEANALKLADGTKLPKTLVDLDAHGDSMDAIMAVLPPYCQKVSR